MAGVPAPAASRKIAGTSNDAPAQAAAMLAAALEGMTPAAASARASAASKASIPPTNATSDQIAAISGAVKSASPRGIAANSFTMGARRAGVEVAQRGKLDAGWWGRVLYFLREADRPAGGLLDLLARDALVQRRDYKLLRLRFGS